MKVPRSLMGSGGNQIVNNLISKANGVGVPVSAGETVNLKLGLGGTFKAPSLKVDLKGTAENLTDQLKQQVTDFAKAKIDSVKMAVKDTIAAIKNQALQKAKEELLKSIGGNKNNNNTNNTLPTDTNKTTTPPAEKPKTNEPVKGLLKDLFGKKKPAVDTAKKQ